MGFWALAEDGCGACWDLQLRLVRNGRGHEMCTFKDYGLTTSHVLLLVAFDPERASAAAVRSHDMSNSSTSGDTYKARKFSFPE